MNLPAILSTGTEYDMSDYVKGLTVMRSVALYQLLPHLKVGAGFMYNESGAKGDL